MNLSENKSSFRGIIFKINIKRIIDKNYTSRYDLYHKERYIMDAQLKRGLLEICVLVAIKNEISDLGFFSAGGTVRSTVHFCHIVVGRIYSLCRKLVIRFELSCRNHQVNPVLGVGEFARSGIYHRFGLDLRRSGDYWLVIVLMAGKRIRRYYKKCCFVFEVHVCRKGEHRS